jgi:glycosyltransferase involved in cell wall biosynthesis
MEAFAQTAELDETEGRPRIGLDLHVADGIYQGSRTHCLELFSRVVKMTPECDFFIFLNQPDRLLEFSPSFGLAHVRILRMPQAPAPWRLLWQLPRLCSRHRLNLLHTQYIAPPWSCCPTAVTVHDILFESFPQFFDRGFVIRSKFLVRSSVERSSEVFTVSEYSRDAIARTYGISQDRIHTIFNGVDRSRFFPGTQGAEVVRDAGLTPGEYFLTVGRLEPRKNHRTLLRAWAALPPPRPKLVIVGQRHFGYDEALGTRKSLNLEQDVLVMENVADSQIPALFRNSKGFVYCSWAEGFGMPVLEAMASGVPVISSASTALREVCLKAAILIDPSDIGALREAIMTLQSKADARQVLIESGLRRALEFSWDASARTVRNVYLDRLATHQLIKQQGSPKSGDRYQAPNELFIQKQRDA